MNILTIPLRNLRRRPSRALLLLSVFTLGIMSIIALYQVSLVIGDSLERKLSAYGANIILSPEAEKLSVSYGGFNMGEMVFDVQGLSETEAVQAIRSIELKERISIVAPKLIAMARVKETPVALVGVRWEEELALKSYWGVQGDFPADIGDLLLGRKVAERFHFTEGDTIPLFDRNFRIAGILYETGSDDDNVILMDLGLLQSLTGKPNQTSFIEVAALCSGCPIDDIVAQIQTNLPGVEIKALQNVINARMASIGFVQQLVFTISLVILITAAAMVGLSMLSAVNERKKDIGILRSLGFGKRQIFVIFTLEAALLGAVAGILGYATGFYASIEALAFLSLSDGAQPVFLFSQLWITGVTAALITILAAAYPAWKGATIEPSEALTAL